ANAGEYTVTAGGGAGTLAAGASRTIKVRFTPTALGPRSAALSIGSDAAGSPHGVTLTGNGVQPGIQVIPTSLDFGDQRVGVVSASRSITVTNTGTAPL